MFFQRVQSLFLSGAIALTSLMVSAQSDLGVTDNVEASMFESLLSGDSGWVQLAIKGVLSLLGLVVVGMVGWIIYLRRSRPTDGEFFYVESSLAGSQFEQILAEIQGLTLRVQGGESKGYYRKIEQLVRVFLEHMGQRDVRSMNDDEIVKILKGADMPQDVAQSLQKVYQCCKQGAERETEKLEFSAAELLKEMRLIIKKVEKTEVHR